MSAERLVLSSDQRERSRTAMIPDETYRRWYALEGDFFEEIIKAIYRERVSPGDLVIDVGANHGLHTAPLAELVGRSGQVTAIEALPHLAANLREALKGTKQVRVVNKAVAASPGHADFVWVKRDEGFSGMRRRKMPSELESDVATVRVDVSTIDRCARRWLSRRRHLSFIKIDIEGGEFDALRGAETILKTDRPLVVFENGGQSAADVYDYTSEDFFRFFEKASYDVHDLFGLPITPQTWDRHDRPWYAIAMPREQAGDGFLDTRLPQQIHRLEERYTPTPAAVTPP